MRRGVTSIVVLLALAAPASGQVRFRSRVGAGTVSGTEEFSITNGPSGHQVTATIAMKQGGADATLTLRQSLTPDWAPETYSVEMTGTMGAMSVTAERKGDVLALAAKTPAGTPTQQVPLKPRLVLMDNMIAAPYQVLLNLTGAQPGEITVVVPLHLASVGGKLEAAGTSEGTLDGRKIVAGKLLLTIAATTVEVYFDPADNRLLRVFAPTQDAELVREGFTPASGAAPPPPGPPEGVTEREVTFKTVDGVPYPAVLCLPASPSPAPVVVMLQGSGPQNRDETIGPNKPFRDLAWALAAQGVATLRYDKRTFAFPKSYAGSLESESIDDGVDAVKYVRTRREVDGSRVYVLGHSLGGLAAIYVAARVPVAGLVLMAAPGRPMDQVIRDQVRTLNAAQGQAGVEATLKMQDAIMAKVRAGTATTQELNGQPPAAVRDMIVRDPIAELQKTTQPLLVLKGGKDAQVFQADFDALQAVAAARPGSEARLFPNLTHIFTPTEGPAEVRAIFQPAKVAPEVSATIAAWIKKGKDRR